ncbi:MAG TPA: TldD/PmbA family protein [Acidimicrobiales bacterium]|nr:TldD/PmbA family protein [Acidimicrobiales bacterium]
MTEPMELCDAVLQLVDGRAEAAVTATVGASSLTRFANSFIHQNVGEQVRRIDLLVAVEGRLASAATTRTDALRRLVDDTIAAAQLRPVDPDWPGLAPPAPVPATASYDEATDHAAPDERAAVARDFVYAARDLKAAGYCSTSGTAVAFGNTAGQRAAARVTEAIVDGIHQTTTSAGSAHRSSSRLGDLDGDVIGSLAVDRARRAVDPRDIEPGDYEVVLSPVAVADVVEFLAYYGLNGKAFVEEQSFARIGEQQFDERITLVDDVTDRRAVGLCFDAEGTPKRPLVLVRNGVTEAVVHDRRSARKMEAESTGHANGGGEGPVASNVFLRPGEASAADLVAGMERGLIVTELNYTRVLDPKTLVVTGLTRNGTFLVEHGRVVGAVANMRFTQSFVDALGPGQVRGIGNDGILVNGATWVPSIHLASWSFTGGARG